MPIDNIHASPYHTGTLRHGAGRTSTKGRTMNAPQPVFDYVAEAHLTASPKFYGELVPLAHFDAVLSQAIDALNALDRVKKCLFYGRELGPLAEGVETGEVYQNCNGL